MMSARVGAIRLSGCAGLWCGLRPVLAQVYRSLHSSLYSSRRLDEALATAQQALKEEEKGGGPPSQTQQLSEASTGGRGAHVEYLRHQREDGRRVRLVCSSTLS